MPSIHAYSREDCAGCGVREALHKHGACVHCGTVREYEPVRVWSPKEYWDQAERGRRANGGGGGEARSQEEAEAWRR